METAYPHSYGTMQNAKAYGMVILGGINSGTSTELSYDGVKWIAGNVWTIYINIYIVYIYKYI